MQGGCFCGAIRYEIDPGDYGVGNCHCSMCRRTSAAAFVSWVVVPRDHFRWLSGEPRALRSSDHGVRRFCSECGTPLVCELSSHPSVVDVTLCSLDQPELLPPKGDVHTDSRLAWVPEPATRLVPAVD